MTPNAQNGLPELHVPVEWRLSPGQTPYPEAVATMEARADAIREEAAPEQVWLVEHPALYTAGTSASADDLLDASRFDVFESGRGGQHTYHGPGQRVAYVMMDLKVRGADVRLYVHDLEEWMIQTLGLFDVEAARREGRIGIWVARADGSGFDDKIGAIGVRVRKWVSFHGLSLNVNPDLEHYSGIVPCGISQHGVTSLAALGVKATMGDVDKALRATFEAVFKRKTVDVPK